MSESQVCRTCHVEKPLDQFSPSKRNRLGVYTQCRPCNSAYVKAWAASKGPEHAERERERQRVSKACSTHDLTRDEYAVLMTSPCHSCGDTEPAQRNRRHHIDHDHVTGAVRGVLCHRCNTALGLLLDDPARIRSLLAYREGATGDYAGRSRRRRDAVGSRGSAPVN